jgi:hypothetical protein
VTPHSETIHRVSLSASISPGASDGVARVGPQTVHAAPAPLSRDCSRVGFSYSGPKQHSWEVDPALVAQRLPIPLRIVCCPYMDSAIWNAVNQPFETQARRPGSVTEGWVTFAGPEGGSPKLVNDRSRSAITTAEGTPL